jgi:hypothetical protein
VLDHRPVGIGVEVGAGRRGQELAQPRQRVGRLQRRRLLALQVAAQEDRPGVRRGEQLRQLGEPGHLERLTTLDQQRECAGGARHREEVGVVA